jgi:hypothetical protein
MENRSRLISNWNRTKEKLKQQFSFLTDEDLYLQSNNQEALLDRLEKLLGKDKQQLLRFITNL